ncbi:MAG: MAPEG family protein [Devosiaceae bacterium]|nr:MAPEG family protein [Devosiaceae bacterium]
MTCLDKLLLGAAFVQVIATLLLMGWAGVLRVGAVRARDVRMKDIALSGEKYPMHARQVANAYDNQFQLPVLFYFGVIVLLVTGSADIVGVALAWCFTVLRLIHIFIHTGTNNLTNRFYAFLFGLVVLVIFLMWVFIPLFFAGAL